MYDVCQIQGQGYAHKKRFLSSPLLLQLCVSLRVAVAAEGTDKGATNNK